MDFLDRLSEVIPDRVKAIIPDRINLSDVPPPLRPLAVMADTLLDQAGLPNIITAEPPARKPKPAASAPARPETVIKPATPARVAAPSIGGFIREQATGFVQDRIAGKPLPINITSILTPGMMALDQAGLGRPLRHGAADLVNGTVETILEGRDFIFGARRDQGWAGPTAQWLEERRRDIARLTGDGNYALYNGAGWSYQGKEGGLTSIFVRQADGSSVMLSPGQAEYWKHMGPYAIPTVFSMFYGGGEVKGVAAAFRMAGSAEMAGGVAVIGGEIGQAIILKPAAYRTLSNLVNDPSLFNDPDAIRGIMDDVFGEYGRNKGSLAGPIYVPTLRDHDDPYQRLYSLSAGSVLGFKRALPTDSFDKPAEAIEVRDFSRMVASSNTYMYGFHGLAAKMADGKTLTNAEYSALRLSLNIFQPENQLSLDPSRLTAADKAETEELVQQYYAFITNNKAVQEQSFAQGKTDEQALADIIAAMDNANAAPVLDIKAIATAEQERIAQERAETLQRIEAETMANLYRGPKI